MESLTGPSHEVRMKVPFFDADPMQIVWHGNYLKYFDIARSELFDALGIDLFAFLESVGFETTVEFSRYEDQWNGIFDSYVFLSKKVR